MSDERRARSEQAVRDWLARAWADAHRRGMPALKPLLASLAEAMYALRTADWNDDAAG